MEMSNAGTQLRSRNAALIPLAGIVLGAIDPAIDAVWATPKRNPASMPGRAHHFISGVNAAEKVVLRGYALKAKKVKYWPLKQRRLSCTISLSFIKIQSRPGQKVSS
ncbi:hypothetical protein [Desulfovibrio sp. 3_1_syn3]|uniref:hypothetical protein n=1 Tax=Desulfovibrio sp. 3_1_syn3 TaxID=457398 RepID=UPI0011C84942|nr:hypothetical protein [Desulfovibrio sp. 3_1_syn3]